MAGISQATPSLQQIVERARILVIDDEDFPYALLFRRDGYNVTKWRDVTKLTDIEQGKYDVILLDLQGIGRKISQDQGLGVLKHIKQVNPGQVVVAYSNAEWPLEYQPFFDMADAVLAKTADYVDFKRSVDELLEEHFSTGFHLSKIDAELDRLGVGGWRARRATRTAVSTGDTTALTRFLRRKGIDQESADLVIGMAQVAIGVAQIWMR